MEPRRILVLKLGALGNIILSLGPFAAIRRHHASAHITLLTLQPYAGWLAEAPWFDEVWIDSRPEWWDLPGMLALRRGLAGGRFDRVYDLQTSSRSSRYFHLFPRTARPEWSASPAARPIPTPIRGATGCTTIDRQFGQLRAAGVTERPPADLSWASGDLHRFAIPGRFALLVPGCSPHRPGKRWPAESYGAIAAWLGAQGIAPVILGSAAERPLAETIRAAAPAARDLTGQTTLGDVASLARAADGGDRQRHRADAPGRHRRLPVHRAVLPRLRSRPVRAARAGRDGAAPAVPRRPGAAGGAAPSHPGLCGLSRIGPSPAPRFVVSRPA